MKCHLQLRSLDLEMFVVGLLSEIPVDRSCAQYILLSLQTASPWKLLTRVHRAPRRSSEVTATFEAGSERLLSPSIQTGNTGYPVSC